MENLKKHTRAWTAAPVRLLQFLTHVLIPREHSCSCECIDRKKHVLQYQLSTALHINEYCDRSGVDALNISVHFIRYRAEEGCASFSSPVWLHLDDEPLVFIHLIDLTPNAIGADSVISGMDSKPTNVLRLHKPFDTPIFDRTKKHAVTPLGSSHGTSYRDVMLINVETEVQQK